MECYWKNGFPFLILQDKNLRYLIGLRRSFEPLWAAKRIFNNIFKEVVIVIRASWKILFFQVPTYLLLDVFTAYGLFKTCRSLR